ncbi:unnamed protein product, partial [Scytosiphon promiscuus]
MVKAILAKAQAKQIAEEAACARKTMAAAKTRMDSSGRRSPPPPYPGPGHSAPAAADTNDGASRGVPRTGGQRQHGSPGQTGAKTGGVDGSSHGRDGSSGSLARLEE